MASKIFFSTKDERTTILKYRSERALNWIQCSWTRLDSVVEDGKICVRTIYYRTVGRECFRNDIFRYRLKTFI